MQLVTDLHMHSTCSDGTFTPTALVEIVAAKGIECMALTDHDTMAGLVEAQRSCSQAGLKFITGVEISTYVQGGEVHLLGYGFEAGNADLDRFLERQRIKRRERIYEFVDRLANSGMNIREEMEAQYAIQDEGSALGRPHLARALIAIGAAVDIQDAFDRLLRPGTATFVPRMLPSEEEVLGAVHAAGGIVSLAHPGDHMRHAAVISLVKNGLDAIETHHPSHDQRLRDYYTQLAGQFGLETTGGSDFHGSRDRDHQNLGHVVMHGSLPKALAN
jgi:predicted metal-dependent phosphoesterase TrpH